MKIFIDPGHGGVDAGASGPSGVLEKSINLKFATLLGDTLLSGGHSVKFSREDDYYMDLSPRAELANEWGADLFLSIHCNTSTPAARGTEVFSYPDSARGAQLARRIQQELTKAWGTIDRGTKTANFAVLRRTSMPAVLVELAFLSNPSEEKLLLNPGMLQRGAQAIYKGITGVAAAPVPEMTISQAQEIITRHIGLPEAEDWFSYILSRDYGDQLLIKWAKSYQEL